MRVMISICLLLLAYVLLRFDFGLTAGWLKALLGTLLLIAGVATWLLDFGKSRGEFRPFRKFGVLEAMFLGGVSMLFVGVLVLVFWFGPPALLEARNMTLEGIGISGGDEGGGDGDGEGEGGGGIDNRPGNGGGIGGNNDDPGITVPGDGGPIFDKFPQVWISPKDDRSREVLGDGAIYISTKSLGKFDGQSSWTAMDPRSEYLEAEEGSGWVNMVEYPAIDSVHYSVTHSSRSKLLHAVQGVERVEVATLKGYGGVGYSLPLNLAKNKRQRKYECVSSPKRLKDFSDEELKLLEVGKGYDALAENRFSNSLRLRLGNWTREFNNMGLDSVGIKVKAIQQYLRNSYRYNLDVKNPTGAPPIENFLFFEKSGYCLHFASAAVLMCRELGIPARLVSGYSGGTYFPKRDRWVFYSDNAHAWMEVNLEGYGWVIVETTPPEAITPGEAPPDQEPHEIPDDEDGAGGYGDGDGEEVDPREHLAAIYQEARVTLMVIAVLFAVLLGIGVWQKKQGGRKRRGGEEEKDERYKFEERVYIALYRKMALLNGLPMMDGDTLMAHVQWLDSKDAKPDFAGELLRYHYDTAYRERDEDKVVEGALLKRIRKWKC